MVELRYNADGKLEYRTSVGSEQIYRFGCNEPIFVTKWDEWKIVPSVEKEIVAPKDNNLRTERITLEITHDCATNIRDWHCWKRENFPLNPHESLRVVEESETSDRCHRWDRDGERCLKCNDKDWMTAEERDAVDHAADIIEDMEDDDGQPLKQKANALRNLLAREEGTKTLTEEISAQNKVIEELKKELDEIKNSSAPVAWGVRMPEAKLWRCSSEKQAKKCVEYFGKGEAIALFEKPQPILTEAEQKAIEYAYGLIKYWAEGADRRYDHKTYYHDHRDALAGLLSRS